MTSFDNASPYRKYYRLTNPVYPSIVRDDSLKWQGFRNVEKVDFLTPFENGYRNYKMHPPFTKLPYTKQAFDSIYDRYIPGLSGVRYKEEPIGFNGTIKHTEPRRNVKARSDSHFGTSEFIRLDSNIADWYFLPPNKRPPPFIPGRQANISYPVQSQNINRRARDLKPSTYSLLRGDIRH